MSNFSKTDLARAIAPDMGVSVAAASDAIDKVFATIRVAAAAGQKVSIPGFGKFEMKHRAARQGRNPSTGQPIDIPASSSLGFKPSKAA